MAKLTHEEEQALEQLIAKRDAPDEPKGGNVQITVDLSDPKAVSRALKLGLLDKGDLDEFDAADDDTGDDDQDDDQADDDEPAPRRRLSLADRSMGVKD